MGRLSEEEAGGRGRNAGGRVGAPTCRGSPEGLGGSLLSLCHLYLYGHAPRLSPAPCPSVPCRRNQCCLNRPLLPKRPLRGPSVHVVPRHAFPARLPSMHGHGALTRACWLQKIPPEGRDSSLFDTLPPGAQHAAGTQHFPGQQGAVGARPAV